MGNGPRVDCTDDICLTQQSAKDECDINLIVDRAKRGADLSHLQRPEGRYGDFRSVPSDLRQAMVQIKQAETLFMSLDAFVRERFSNDPARMIDFLHDPKNRQEAISLGLVQPPPVANPPPVDSVSPPSGRNKVAEGGKKPKADDDD